MKCYHPVTLRNDRGNTYCVPCGKCAWCRARLRNEWFFRMMQECKGFTNNRFVTLSYEDSKLPFNINEDGEVIPVVSKVDTRSMFRKMWNDKLQFRYFLASEYGPRTFRPHYHMAVFTNEDIDYRKYWDKGFVLDLPLNDGGMKYITKYLLKGSNVPDGAVPNFRCMSKGIGKSFQYKGQPYLLTPDGVLPVGHYYRRRYIASLNEKLKNEIKAVTMEYLESHDPDDSLYARYLKASPRVSFEAWKALKYNKDYNSQIKINKK